MKELTCVPCSFENVQVKAAYFCHTCKDPEPLCETCSTQHTRQKLTRGHEIYKDIWKYFKLHAILGYSAFCFLLHATFIVCARLESIFQKHLFLKLTFYCMIVYIVINVFFSFLNCIKMNINKNIT